MEAPREEARKEAENLVSQKEKLMSVFKETEEVQTTWMCSTLTGRY
jgi:hypothetical protein